jgi:diaminohydroxyphosphoribosylaminopyrimidine deaminase/5-amino-6-(5-phosphoribosylamino)uracil reductase
MAMTLNGEAAVGGRASTIGTPVDGVALTRVRAAADAVLTGFGTLLAEDVTAALPEEEAARRTAAGRSGRLLAVVLTSGRTLDPSILTRRFFTDPRFDRLVITGMQCNPRALQPVEDRGIEVVRVASGPDGRPDPTAAIRLLGDRGARVIVSEGGPRVLASLLRARLVREYFQTQSPLATGVTEAPRPIMGDVTAGDRPLLLGRVSRHEFAFTDPVAGARLVEVYERYRVVYPPER